MFKYFEVFFMGLCLRIVGKVLFEMGFLYCKLSFENLFINGEGLVVF